MNNKALAVMLALAFHAMPARAAPANPNDFDRLDYARQRSDQGITFVPFKGTENGVVLYADYRPKVTAPTKFREFVRRFVNVRPVAFDDGRYAAFFAANPTLRDTRRVLTNELESHCELTDELRNLLRDVPYPPAVFGPAYPDLCSVSLIYPLSLAQPIEALIQSGEAVRLRGQIALCSAGSTTYRARTLMDALVAALAPAKSASAPLVSKYGQLVRRLAEFTHDPELGAVTPGVATDGRPLSDQEADAERDAAARDFLRRFVRSSVPPSNIVTVELDDTPDPIYLCLATPLALNLLLP